MLVMIPRDAATSQFGSRPRRSKSGSAGRGRHTNETFKKRFKCGAGSGHLCASHLTCRMFPCAWNESESSHECIHSEAHQLAPSKRYGRLPKYARTWVYDLGICARPNLIPSTESSHFRGEPTTVRGTEYNRSALLEGV